MPDPIPTPAVPGVEPIVTPAPAPAPAESSTIREMRAQLDALAKQNQELTGKLTEAERKDMDEKARLAAELDDAKKILGEVPTLRDQLGRFQSGIQTACDQAIQAIPEEKRAAIEALTKHIPIEERLAGIQSAIAAIGVAPAQFGTRTQPGQTPGTPPGAPEPAKPLTPKEVERLSWDEAFAGRANSRPTNSLEARIAALEKK